VTAASCGSCGVRRSTISLVYSVVSAIGVVSGGFGFLLLCEDVSRRLKIGISDGAVVAVPATPGTAVISCLNRLLLIVADAIADTLEAGVSPLAPKRRCVMVIALCSTRERLGGKENS
jgi:hypothetical protein